MFLLVVTIVTSAAIYSLYLRDEQQRQYRQLSQPAPTGSDASEILKNAPNGYIQAEWRRMPPEHIKDNPAPNAAPAAEAKQDPQDDNGLEAARKEAWNRYWDEYKEVHKQRFEKRKEALLAKDTAVELPHSKAEKASAAATVAAPSPAATAGGWSGGPNGFGVGGLPGYGQFGFPGLATPQIDREGQQQKIEFASQKGDLGKDDVVPTVRKPPDPYAVAAGSFVKFTTVKEVNSDTPGSTIGRVTESVYNNDGTCILIPQNSVLLGHYNSVITHGQSRLPGVLTRINFPDGSHQAIGAMEMADNAGAAGLEGFVNRHLIQKFGSAAIAGLFGAGIYLAVPHTNSIGGPDAQQIIAASLAQQIGQVGQQMALQNLSIPNTITIHAGEMGTMIPDRDIRVDPPWRCNGSRGQSFLPIMSIGR